MQTFSMRFPGGVALTARCYCLEDVPSVRIRFITQVQSVVILLELWTV